MQMSKVIMYGAPWCGDCVRSKRLMDEHAVEFEFRDIDTDPGLAGVVIAYNEQLGLGPKRRIPVIVIGEQVLSEPTNDELAAALGIKL
jgi:glutaredoxin